MKSGILTSLAIICASLLFCSCHKEYDCVCTDAISGRVVESKIKAARKNDAGTSCKNHRSVFTTGEYSCTLKEN